MIIIEGRMFEILVSLNLLHHICLIVLCTKTAVSSEEESWSKYQTNIEQKGNFKRVGGGGGYLLLTWLWFIVLNILF